MPNLIATSIGPHTVYLGDMREVVPHVGKVNCIVTDPPYRLTSGGPSGMLGGVLDPKNYKNDGAIVKCDIEWWEIMPVLVKALDDGDAYIMANNRNLEEMLIHASYAGFEFHNVLIWDKISATANRWYMKNCEFTGYFYRGKAKMINDCSAKQIIRCPQKDEAGKFYETAEDKRAGHPTEKPVALMQHYIENSTQPGDVVLDPFAGAGSTGVACVKSGRKFVGIELEEKHFAATCRRIESAMRDMPTFL